MDDIENWYGFLSSREEPCDGCGCLDCECDLDPDDCLNCGVCESCIDRSIAFSEESEPRP